MKVLQAMKNHTKRPFLPLKTLLLILAQKRNSKFYSLYFRRLPALKSYLTQRELW